MQGTDDAETHPLVVTLRDDPIRESDEAWPSVIVDVGKDGGVVRSEILRSSIVVANRQAVESAPPA